MSDAQKDSPLEQLAQRFETYADDNEALLSRGHMYKAAERVKIGHRIATWRDVAKELREIEADLLRQDRVLLLCSAATRLPVAE